MGWRKFSKALHEERSACEVCGITAAEYRTGYLEVHHVLKRRTHRRHKYDKENCMVLCQECHVTLEVVSKYAAIAEMRNNIAQIGGGL